MNRAQRYKKVLQWFEKNNPDAASELHFDNAWQLLAAVMLSAQCTDKRVNTVTPALFKKYPTPESMSRSGVEEIYGYIKSVSYPNSKAAHLYATACMLEEKYKGEVPRTVEELVQLPGVGRKTANVVVSVMWNQPRIAVDTHVFRVSNRLGLVEAKTPLQAEEQLMENIPLDKASRAHHWLLLHGRYVCTSRNPKCSACGLRRWCLGAQPNRRTDLRSV